MSASKRSDFSWLFTFWQESGTDEAKAMKNVRDVHKARQSALRLGQMSSCRGFMRGRQSCGRLQDHCCSCTENGSGLLRGQGEVRNAQTGLLRSPCPARSTRIRIQKMLKVPLTFTETLLSYLFICFSLQTPGAAGYKGRRKGLSLAGNSAGEVLTFNTAIRWPGSDLKAAAKAGAELPVAPDLAAGWARLGTTFPCRVLGALVLSTSDLGKGEKRTRFYQKRANWHHCLIVTVLWNSVLW